MIILKYKQVSLQIPSQTPLLHIRRGVKTERNQGEKISVPAQNNSPLSPKK